MKVSYNKIETREELKNRIENGVLSVGCYMPRLKGYFSETQTEKHLTQVTVIYSARYGNATKVLWL